MTVKAREVFSKLAGSDWDGLAELWLDPAGNDADKSACTLHVEADRLEYTWSREGTEHRGTLALTDDGARWQDGWHQSDGVDCTNLPGTWAVLAVGYSYRAPGTPDWGWRITFIERPSGELVLQMTNVAPWGEEFRAVRMTFERRASAE